MELRHLRYFVAVAEELNFTRAAERLGIKQPPLSAQIKQLEKELGTALLRRLNRGVELTAAGKLFLEQARSILEQVDRAKTEVKRRARGETGQISLGVAGACYFHPLVTVIMSQFTTLYADIVVSPEESDTATLIARVHAGKVDAAFVRSPGAEFGGLALEPIAEEDTLVVVPEGGAFRQAPSVPLTALAKEKFILVPRRRNVGFHDSIIRACRSAGFQPILGQEAPDLVTTIAMVVAGGGVSIVPRSLSRLRLRGVAYLAITGDRPTAPISLAHRLKDQSPVVRNLVSFVRRSIQPADQGKKTA